MADLQPVRQPVPIGRLETSLEGLLADRQLSLPAPSQEVHAGYRRVTINSDDPHFGWLLALFAPVNNAWLSWIEPGGFVRPHKDAGPHRERWQVPIRPSGWMTVDGERLEAEPGVPFQVKHWLEHEVVVGDTARVHVVLDRDVFVTEEKSPFVLV